ncbi:NADPH-dependent FMN reductase [Trichoderma gamsii]|uniref:NADPH-dependent FMN reductase n=1 Tax=Trichoderma gamsii TaxID=398673 RepID=A0A2P4ZUN9_9HYPO|nr:NADPH-dependent FMN reductase [Trichoderma gamsii]PON27995.1 NADPH-dependent FMN reductase [Trichoderma gamsii]
MASKIAIIITSTRTPRVGPHIATFVHNILKSHPSASSSTFSIVDVDTFKLPVFDEPVVPANVPARGSFIHDHSKKWSAEIASHDAYVLIAPEYNYGVAGSTKNAIDYLKNEWDGKPAAIVTYGIQGGKTASEQIKGTLEGMGLRVSATRPQLAFVGGLGPDTFAAVGEGKLGDASKTEWEEKHSEEILQSYKEILDALANPVEKKE